MKPRPQAGLCGLTTELCATLTESMVQVLVPFDLLFQGET